MFVFRFSWYITFRGHRSCNWGPINTPGFFECTPLKGGDSVLLWQTRHSAAEGDGKWTREGRRGGSGETSYVFGLGMDFNFYCTPDPAASPLLPVAPPPAWPW